MPVEFVTDYLAIGGVLFAIGAAGFLARRNLITMFLCVELMLQGVALSLVAFSATWRNYHGQAFALFTVAVAAAEAGVALALVLLLFRQRRSLDVLWWQELREPGLPLAKVPEQEPVDEEPTEPQWPKLPPAGLEPVRKRETVDVG